MHHAWNDSLPHGATEAEGAPVASIDAVASFSRLRVLHVVLTEANGPLLHCWVDALSSPALRQLRELEYEGEFSSFLLQALNSLPSLKVLRLFSQESPR